MANQFNTGAILYYVRFGGGATPFFLGTGEGRPRIENRPEYIPLHNDLSGVSVPLDFSFQGMTALNSIVLTRWNEPVVQFIERQPNPLSTALAAGEWAIKDVGTLMAMEGKAMELWCVLPNATNGSIYISLPAAYHYLQCVVWNPMAMEAGTSPAKRHLLFYSWPKLDLTNSKFVLWDQSITGLPAID